MIEFKKEVLENMYLSGMSLQDIGISYGCSRENIFYQFKKFNIPLRTKSQSRELVYENKKIIINRIYDRDLFKKWSPKMSYILGLLYTDGNVSHSQGKNKVYKRFSFAQTNIEFFEKVCNLLSFSGTTYINKRTHCNNVIISNNDMVEDLEKLGLHPNKSFTVRYPELPMEFDSHFIRGVFDGDGTSLKYRIRIVSASFDFVNEISKKLFDYNIENKIYSYKYHEVTIQKKFEMKKFYDFIYSDKGELFFDKKFKKFTNNLLSLKVT